MVLATGQKVPVKTLIHVVKVKVFTDFAKPSVLRLPGIGAPLEKPFKRSLKNSSVQNPWIFSNSIFISNIHSPTRRYLLFMAYYCNAKLGSRGTRLYRPKRNLPHPLLSYCVFRPGIKLQQLCTERDTAVTIIIIILVNFHKLVRW